MTRKREKSPKKNCRYCGAEISKAATICASCWRDLKTGKAVSGGAAPAARDGGP